jgi:predicted RNA-binding Zn ribbon-like protein
VKPTNDPRSRSRAVGAVPTHPSIFACVDLVNSQASDYLGAGPGFDRLDDPEWQSWFLDRYRLGIDGEGAVPLDNLRRLRRELRLILEGWSRRGMVPAMAITTLDRWLRVPVFRRRLAGSRRQPRLSLVPERRDWTWVLSSIAASAAELIAAGSHQRLKVCANVDCSWMFYDQTLNTSRRFCSTSPCGNLVRVREFRSHVRRE